MTCCQLSAFGPELARTPSRRSGRSVGSCPFNAAHLGGIASTCIPWREGASAPFNAQILEVCATRPHVTAVTLK